MANPEPTAPASPTPEAAPKPAPGHALVLALAALGVVYGDIGTSPLYAIREGFSGHFGVEPSHANILGVLSLVFWSLVLVVAVKYLGFVLRADNQGEGGILALMSLVHPEHAGKGRLPGGSRRVLILLGLFGAALLYADGMLTPAISVVSAMEGLTVAESHFQPWVIPLTCAILVILFTLQRRGTAHIGGLFGPVMILWFLTLAALGIRGILFAPEVLDAVRPEHAVLFFLRHGSFGILVLGAVFLVVTGAEALYADMGHFGARPIRSMWFVLVMPALLLNYFGQGALLWIDPATVDSPFYRLAPEWGLYPLIGLATAATIIASQAIITGAFSLSTQAVQFGYSPWLNVRHTSATERGQVYLPGINWALMIATIGLVLGFRSSSGLAAAYGLAVALTMVITTILLYVVAHEVWHWPRWAAALAVTGFLGIDLLFLSANLVKIEHGGWCPLAVAATICTLVTTWRRGRRILASRLEAQTLPLKGFIGLVRTRPPTRVKGTGVFMTPHRNATPLTLVRNLSHNKILHERVIILTVTTEDVPRVPTGARIAVEDLGDGFYRMFARYGFMEDPKVPEMFALARMKGLDVDFQETTFFLGRERALASQRPGGMALWREKLFAVMVRNAQRPVTYYHLPPDRVVELGAHVEI